MALPPLQSLAAWTDLILTEEPRYIDCGLLGTLTKLAFRANLVLEGPKGIGKSLALAAVAHKLQVPLVTIS